MRVDFDLRADIYKLAAFTVTGEREGMAASITQQRNAPNVKAVVDMDAFGNMPNQNAGEVLIRLAGVAPILSNEGLVTSVMIRGAPADLSTLSVDGKLQADSVLEPGPSAYSCLTVLADEGIGILYESGGPNACDTLTFAAFPLDWVLEARPTRWRISREHAA